MSKGADAALPLFISGAFTLLAGRALDEIVSTNIERYFETVKGKINWKPYPDRPPFYLPGEFEPRNIAAAMSWAIDQYTLLLQTIATPFLGLFVTPGDTKVNDTPVYVIYGLCTIGLFFTYGTVHRRTPGAYKADCNAASVPCLGPLLAKIPIIRSLSWSVLAGGAVALMGGVASLIFVH